MIHQLINKIINKKGEEIKGKNLLLEWKKSDTLFGINSSVLREEEDDNDYDEEEENKR